jgi:hypothetical protein
MKKLLVIIAGMFILFTSCQQQEFNDKYTGTLVWPLGDGIPPDITCESNGTDCHRGLLTDNLGPNVQQWYQYVNEYINPNLRTTTKVELNTKNPEVQIALFIYYKNNLNIKDYFKNENWQALFKEVSEDETLKNIVTNGAFELLFVKNDDSILFVKDAQSGYGVENVLYAYKSPSNMFNTIK